MKTSKATLSALALLWCTTTLADAPDPNSVYVESLQFNGSGCPAGSAVANLSDDRQALTLLFDDFIVDSTESQAPVQEKNCNMDLKLNVPEGWTYSLFCVDYRGFAGLDEGATGAHKATFAFSDGRRQDLGSMSLKGPYFDDYSRLVALPVTNLPFSRCGTPDKLQISTSIKVESRGELTSKDLHCSSSRGRPASCEVGQPIERLELVRRQRRSVRHDHIGGVEHVVEPLAASTGGKTRNRASLGLDTWNTIDVETKKRRDANMGKSGPSRGNKPDAYDAEYDKGRVKKVRKKGDEPGANNSKLFDAFQKTVKKTKSLMTKAKKALGGKKRKRST